MALQQLHQHIYLSVEIPGGKQLSFEGKIFGGPFHENVDGEVVFQTGVVGYPESLSDPSYCNQILVLTYPLIGSYGIPNDEAIDAATGVPLNVESDKVHVKALVVGEYIHTPSHHESHQTLDAYLKKHNVVGIEGIDTRRLTQIIRDHGTLRGIIHQSRNVKFESAPPHANFAHSVCIEGVHIKVLNRQQPDNYRVCVVDCGIKNNQLRMLMREQATSLCIVGIKWLETKGNTLMGLFQERGCRALFISNGPGDPRDHVTFITQLREFMLAHTKVPIMGICLGHQLLGLAANFDVCKLKYGNRGHNQPCKLVGTTRTFQTTQNHGYAVVYSPSKDWRELFINLNDQSNEGLMHNKNPWFSVQFHPEAKAGPEDTAKLIDIFLNSSGELTKWIESFPAPVPLNRRSKVLVLGSGGLCIGQSGEFDYSGSQAIKAFREEGLVVVLVNPNIATNQTTPGFVDRVYFLPVTPEYVEKVIEIERPDCIALSFGGQTALNCIAEGTNITLSDGTSRKIEDLMYSSGVYVYSPKIENGSVVYDTSKKCEKGIIQNRAKCIELTLYDGRTLICTPEHLILTSTGEWVPAGNLEIDVHKVSIAPIEAVIDSTTPDEKIWTLQVDAKVLSMQDAKSRIEALAFARILGMLYSDGHITKRNAKCPGHEIIVATEIDRDQVVSDVTLLMGRAPYVRHYPSNDGSREKHGNDDSYAIYIIGWAVALCDLPGVMCRGGLSQVPTLPLFLDSAPVSIIREFLGGLFGGDGHAPYMHTMKDQDDILCHVKFMHTVRVEYLNEMKAYMGHITNLLSRCGVNTENAKLSSRIHTSVKDDIVRYDIQLHLDSLSFAERVGFRYCVQKQCRLSAACIIWRRTRIATEQRKQIAHRIMDIKSSHPSVLYNTARDEALSEFRKTNIIDKDRVSWPCPYLRELKRATNTIEDQQTPHKIEILNEIGASDWFGVTNQGNSIVGRHDRALPSLYLRVIGKRDVGEHPVYDLTIADNHSFVAGGVAVHNCGTKLKLSGVLEKYGIEVLGTPVETIIVTEDRQAFKKHIQSIGERIPNGAIATNVDDAVRTTKEIGYPVLVRAAFTLGGQGSGFATNEAELRRLLQVSFSSSDQVIIDKSFRGWKELEYEIVRDRYGNCLSVCNMENLDPLGVHTGESIVVAPSQTLSDDDYNRLRTTALKTISSLGVVGECNIQFALDPKSREYYIIEINARLSRSSALASKATGYPLAYVAAKLGLGYGLDELKNSITGTTTVCFEPSLDYCVVKVPRWDLTKFQHVNTHIGSAMKSVGEGMAISRCFEEALQSAIRMTGMNCYGLQPGVVECTDEELRDPTYRRILAVATGLWSGAYTIDRIYELSGIDRWFLEKINNIMNMVHTLTSPGLTTAKTRRPVLLKAKKLGFSDAAIAHYVGSTELVIRGERQSLNICPDVKQIDTVAAEFPCRTNYCYTTYATNPRASDITPVTYATNPRASDITPVNANKIIVIGSGVYQIGSSVEFDWCAVNCIRELRKNGKEVVMINCNPETVSTDYDEADHLYFSEISLETVLDIQDVEKASGVIVSVGGQLPNNIAMGLHLQGVRVIGTSAENIDCAENRKKFSRMLDRGGIDQPEWKELESVDAAIEWSASRFPVLVRPSYVLSGAAMNVAYSANDLRKFLGAAVAVSRDHPVVISKFINDAKEIEVDAVAAAGIIRLMAISEHVENAGVHSGDATLIFPSQDVTPATRAQITHIAHYIAKTLEINGPFNIQFIAKDDQVKVIECNLRVSRSFPFVSKTLGVNFIECATQILIGNTQETPLIDKGSLRRIGVKVAQFSFNRLSGAEILLGVEMQSTGEVACFGSDHRIAYLKALVASGFVLPPPNSAILLSIGGHAFKKEFKMSVEMLKKLGYKIYGTRNTASYYEIPEMRMQSRVNDNIMSWIGDHKFSMIINITERNKMRCVEELTTPGYQLRQAATANNIPIVTDIKAAKLLVNSLNLLGSTRVTEHITTEIDCFTGYNIVRIPGLIDVHVHVRDPGETQKEDWDTCTAAALAGGVTMLCAMPNTKPSLLGLDEYNLVDSLASAKARCDYALFAGASIKNISTIHEIADKCAGLKLYLNNTHGDLLLSNCLDWAEHIKNWNHPTHPICVHAEGQTLSAVLHLANIYQRRIHICHVSKKEEIGIIRLSKAGGMQVTCEVAPHHLFLIADVDNKMCTVKPPLQSQEDQQALWDNLDIIDCFATDHAPHLPSEKQCCGCPGFPGLETALPLLLTAVNQKRLTLEDIVLRYYTNPRKIFNLPEQPNTYIEIDMNQRYIIPFEPQMSKCKWTPFAGFECIGAVKRVVLRGENVYISDKPNQGLLIRPSKPIFNVRLLSRLVVKNVVTTAIGHTSSSPYIIKRYTEASFDKNVLSADQFTKEGLRMLFERADDIRHQDQLGQLPQSMAGKMLGLFFFEPSTRTRTSFETAMKRMGGNVINVHAEQSSVKKGESLEDSIISLQACGQLNAIVIRHPEKGSSHRAARVADVPIINGGDGSGEHPTQTLIDLYTIRRELGSVGGICVAFIGDLRFGRTVHSLAKALALRENVRIYYISPKELSIPRKIYNYVAERGIEQHENTELNDELLGIADVLYVTRIQRERHDEALKTKLAVDPYCITPGVLAKTKPSLRVLHPLPRGTEISTDIDRDPRAAYKRQMENGPYVRMALLSLLIK
jgi:carbamoyl-phosphate synthase/aspartate carbamoyltransferase/dihydroorotase